MTGLRIQDTFEMYIALHEWFSGLIPDAFMLEALEGWHRTIEA
jgi:hypothetical protein